MYAIGSIPILSQRKHNEIEPYRDGFLYFILLDVFILKECRAIRIFISDISFIFYIALMSLCGVMGAGY